MPGMRSRNCFVLVTAALLGLAVPSALPGAPAGFPAATAAAGASVELERSDVLPARDCLRTPGRPEGPAHPGSVDPGKATEQVEGGHGIFVRLIPTRYAWLVFDDTGGVTPRPPDRPALNTGPRRGPQILRC